MRNDYEDGRRPISSSSAFAGAPHDLIDTIMVKPDGHAAGGAKHGHAIANNEGEGGINFKSLCHC